MEQSVNDIKLNELIIAQLYRHSLVEVDDDGKSSRPGPRPDTLVLKREDDSPAEVRFLGNNEKKITILVNDPGNTFMPEGHLAFLTKILGACKLNIGDVAIVNTAHTSDVDNIIANLKPARIFTFGIDATITGVDHVKAPAVGELVPETDEAKAKKAKLWTDLKRLLGL